MLQALGSAGLIVLGAVLTLATTVTVEWLRDERLTRRERNRARADFQRETLLALQDAVGDLVRATGMIWHEDSVAYRRTGKWRGELLSKEANDLDFSARSRCSKLRVRVNDADVRGKVKQLESDFAGLLLAKSEREALDKMLKTNNELVEPIHERIGHLLRDL